MPSSESNSVGTIAGEQPHRPTDSQESESSADPSSDRSSDRPSEERAAQLDSSTEAVSAEERSSGQMGPPKPPLKESLREQKKSRAREQILNAAKLLINTEGYGQTKMRDVAKNAGMSYQTLYNYFPTKGLILQELLTRDLVKLRRRTFDELHRSEPLMDKLRELAKSYTDAIAPDDRHLWKEVCAELLKVTSHHSCLLALIDEQALNKLRELLARAQQSAELDPHVDSEALAGVVYSLLDAALVRYLVNENLSRVNVLSAISSQILLTVTPYLR